MKCPECGCGSSRVLRSWQTARGTNPSRQCASCGATFRELLLISKGLPPIIERFASEKRNWTVFAVDSLDDSNDLKAA